MSGKEDYEASARSSLVGVGRCGLQLRARRRRGRRRRRRFGGMEQRTNKAKEKGVESLSHHDVTAPR